MMSQMSIRGVGASSAATANGQGAKRSATPLGADTDLEGQHKTRTKVRASTCPEPAVASMEPSRNLFCLLRPKQRLLGREKRPEAPLKAVKFILKPPGRLRSAAIRKPQKVKLLFTYRRQHISRQPRTRGTMQ